VFAHVNARHHSLAFGPGRSRSAFHHFMVEVSDLDAVGRAYDRLETMGLPIATTIGKHTNDEMVSFYVRTPSGFEIEYGCGGRKVDDATWVPVTYDSPDAWGPQAHSVELRETSMSNATDAKTFKTSEAAISYHDVGTGPALLCLHVVARARPAGAISVPMSLTYRRNID